MMGRFFSVFTRENREIPNQSDSNLDKLDVNEYEEDGFRGEKLSNVMHKEGFREIKLSQILQSLSENTWDYSKLIDLANLCTSPERELVELDALRANPDDYNLLKKLLQYEFDLYLEDGEASLDLLTNRLERVFSSSKILEKTQSINSVVESLNRSYTSDPYKTRGIALVLCKIFSNFSPIFSLSLYSKLKRNMLDERTKKVAFNCSKLAGRYLLSLELIDAFEHPDEADYQMRDIHTRVLKIIFEDDFRAYQNMLLRYDAEYESGGLIMVLENMSPYSSEIHNFITKYSDGATFDFSDHDGIKKLRIELKDIYDKRLILTGKSYKRGKFAEDLEAIPLYSIRRRLSDEALDSDGLVLLSGVKKILESQKISKRRGVEIVICLASELRNYDKTLALEAIEYGSHLFEGDERIARLNSIILSDNGYIEKAVKNLHGFEQPSTIKLKENLGQILRWINNGFDLNYLGDKSEDYSPKRLSVMYNVHSSLPYKTSGYTIRTREVVSAIKDMGLDISINVRWGFPTDRTDVIASDFGPLRDTFSDGGLDYTISPDSRGLREFKFEDYSRLAAESILERAVEKRPMAIFSASDATVGLASSMVARSLKIPFIYEMRGLWAMTRSANNPEFQGSARYDLMMKMEKQCALSATIVLTISDRMRRIVEGWGVERSKIMVLPNGIDSTWDSRSRLGEDGSNSQNTVFGYLGSIVPYEGLETIVEVAEVVKNYGLKGIKFVVVGNGSAKDDLIELVLSRNLSDLVDIREGIPNEMVPKFYAEVDAIILPRLDYEVCQIVPALKPLEAMANAKCVISSDVYPARELISDGENGILFQAGNSKDLAEKIIEIVKNDVDLEKIGKQGEDFVKRERVWPSLLSEIVCEIYTLQICTELNSKSPDTKYISYLIDKTDQIGSRDGEGSRVALFNEILKRKTGIRARRNAFLAFLRSLGDSNPENAVRFFLDWEEFVDHRSARSAVTFAKRAGLDYEAGSIIKRHVDILDEAFIEKNT